MTIGILALQGAYIEHAEVLSKLKVDYIFVNKKELLNNLNGIIIPGGESTVISRLLQELNMFKYLQQLILEGLPVFGTCAGLILLSKNVLNEQIITLKTMDITIKRNAYGRQINSFKREGFFLNQKIPMVFIRAPIITEVGSNVEILANVDKMIVAAKSKNQLVTTFHPELTTNLTLHKYFLDMVK